MAANKNLYSDKMSHKCIIRIQSVYDTLKTAEKRAADFMIQNPGKIAETNITEAAELAGCSEATLVRLARKLRYTGYPELKSSILQNDKESGFLYQELSADDNPIDVADKVFKTSIQSLVDTRSLLDEQQYMLALDALKNAGHILFAGVGDAYAVAYTGYLKFSRCGMSASCSQDFDIQIIEASKLKENDVLVVISHTGRTQTIYDTVKYAKFRKAKVIAITNYPTSPIAKQADYVLLTAAFVPSTFGEVMTKRIPELCVLETLYVNVMMQASEQTNEILANSNNAVFINKM